MADPKKARPARRKTASNAPANLFIRVFFADGSFLGPGKVELMELVDHHGSIASAGKAMGMSYKRAWYLIDATNQMFKEPLVVKQHGGTSGGGAVLTPTGHAVVQHYRALQRVAAQSGAKHLDELCGALRKRPRGSGRR